MKPDECQGCPLYNEPGPVYPQQSSLEKPVYIIIGEAPGADEVDEGVPFIGASGKKLRWMLSQAGIRSSYCHITNCVMCRPPNNRTPTKEEVAFCTTAWKDKEFERFKKFTGLKYFLVGGVASEAILGETIAESMGYTFPAKWGQGVMMPIYHPAYLLRNPKAEPMVQQLINKLSVMDASPEEDSEPDFIINPKLYDLVEFISKCRSYNYVVFDTETRSIEDTSLHCIGIADRYGNTVSVPWNVNTAEILRPLFADATVDKIAFNVRFDARVMLDNGFPFNGRWIDIQRLVQLDDVVPGGQFIKLEAVAPLYLSNVTSWKRKSSTEGMLVYNAKDTRYEWEIYQKLRRKLLGKPAWSLFERTVDLDKVVFSLERRGFLIDVPLMMTIKEDAGKQYEEEKKQWDEQYRINPHSPKQVIELFEDRKIKLWRTNQGKTSTQERYLKLTAAAYPKHAPLIHSLIRLRYLRKAISTYMEYVPSPDGALHPNVFTTGTISGRFSYSRPNLANIPKHKDEFGIRRIFVARPGYKLISADWSQAEARVTAILANEEPMLEAFASGRDIHRFVAERLFNKPADEVTKKERHNAKTCLFGLSYGAGYRKLAEQADVSFQEARTFISLFEKAFPAYFAQLQKWSRIGAEEGFLVNPFGRPHSFGGDRVATQARNYIPQSTVADMINISLCQLFHRLQGKDAHILLQIYDQVIVEVAEHLVDEVKQDILEVMNQPWPELNGHVIPADADVGKNWGEV